MNVGGLSSWSLLKLGWMDKSLVIRQDTRSEGTFNLDALGVKDGKTFLLQVHKPGTGQDYYVELREKVGADAEIPSRYSTVTFGIVVYLIGVGPSPEEGLVQVIDSHPGSNSNPARDLFDAPFNIGKNGNPAFVDDSVGLSVIVLKRAAYTYTVMLGSAAQGEQARTANDAIAKAQDGVLKAEGQSRTIGLDAGKEELRKAQAAYEGGQFAEATTNARNALNLATAATAPATTITSYSATTISSQTETETSQPTQVFPTLAIYGIASVVAVGVLLAFWFVRKRRT